MNPELGPASAELEPNMPTAAPKNTAEKEVVPAAVSPEALENAQEIPTIPVSPKEGQVTPPNEESSKPEDQPYKTSEKTAAEDETPVPEAAAQEAEQAKPEQPEKVESEQEKQRRENFRLEVLRFFPELEKAKEKGEVMQEALAELLMHEKVTLTEIRFLVPNGFEFLADQELPPEWQPDDPNAPRDKWVVGMNFETGTVQVFEEFFDEGYDTISRAELLGHELGESAQLRVVKREQKEDRSVEKTPLVDIEKYKTIVENRPLEWSDPYVRGQSGREHYWSEMLADDIGDFLLSNSPEEMLWHRLRRFREEAGRDELLSQLKNNDEAIQPMLDDAKQVYEFLTQEFNEKRTHIKGQEPGGGGFIREILPQESQQALPSSKVEKGIADKAIDWLFFAGQPLG